MRFHEIPPVGVTNGHSLNGASCHAADRVRGQARGAEQAVASGLIGNGGTHRRPELPGSAEEAFST